MHTLSHTAQHTRHNTRSNPLSLILTSTQITPKAPSKEELRKTAVESLDVEAVKKQIGAAASGPGGHDEGLTAMADAIVRQLGSIAPITADGSSTSVSAVGRLAYTHSHSHTLTHTHNSHSHSHSLSSPSPPHLLPHLPFPFLLSSFPLAAPLSYLPPATTEQLLELLRQYKLPVLRKHFAAALVEYIKSATSEQGKGALGWQLVLQLLLHLEAKEHRGEALALKAVTASYEIYGDCIHDWQHWVPFIWFCNQLPHRLTAAYMACWVQFILPTLVRPEVTHKGEAKALAGMLLLFPPNGTALPESAGDTGKNKSKNKDKGSDDAKSKSKSTAAAEGSAASAASRPYALSAATNPINVGRATRLAQGRPGEMVCNQTFLLLSACFDKKAPVSESVRRDLRIYVFPLLRLMALKSAQGPARLFHKLMALQYTRSDSELQAQQLQLANLCLAHEPAACLPRLKATVRQRPTTVAILLAYMHSTLVPRGTSAVQIAPVEMERGLLGIGYAAQFCLQAAAEQAQAGKGKAKAKTKAKKGSGGASGTGSGASTADSTTAPTTNTSMSFDANERAALELVTRDAEALVYVARAEPRFRRSASRSSSGDGVSWLMGFFLLLSVAAFVVLWTHLMCRFHANVLGQPGRNVCHTLESRGYLAPVDAFYDTLRPHAARLEPLAAAAAPHLQQLQQTWVKTVEPWMGAHVYPYTAPAWAKTAPVLAQVWNTTCGYTATLWVAIQPAATQAWTTLR